MRKVMCNVFCFAIMLLYIVINKKRAYILRQAKAVPKLTVAVSRDILAFAWPTSIYTCML